MFDFKSFILAFLIGLLGIWIGTGCSSDMSVDDKIALMDAAVDMAKKANVEATLTFDLPTAVGWHTSSEIGSKGSIRAVIHINPAQDDAPNNALILPKGEALAEEQLLVAPIE